MLVHCQDVAKAAIEWSLLIDRGAARRLVDELHHLDADAHNVRIGAGEKGKLPLRWLPAVEKGRPQIAHGLEKIRAGGGEKRLCPSHGLLHVDIFSKRFGRLNTLAERVAPCRLARRALDNRVDRVTSDT